MHDFRTPEAIEDCKILSDKLIGGFSTARLDWIPPSISTASSSLPSENPRPFARFHGVISSQLPQDRPDVVRSGYAAWRTRDMPPTIFGRSLWNIDPYAFLALRIKSDGRAYFINVQSESIVPSDLHQHRLFARRPGEWETVILSWNDFVRTSHGFPVEPQTELLRQKVKSIGIGLTDRVDGPFEICIEKIWATNTMEDGDTRITHEEEDHPWGQLKNKKGEHVAWDDTEQKSG